MSTNTEYKIVSGNKIDFENESNRLALEGWIWCGSMTMIKTEQEIYYAHLMSRMLPSN